VWIAGDGDPWRSSSRAFVAGVVAAADGTASGGGGGEDQPCGGFGGVVRAPRRVGVVLFDRLELLDVFGPLELFRALPDRFKRLSPW
jgi:hypothetical protein